MYRPARARSLEFLSVEQDIDQIGKHPDGHHDAYEIVERHDCLLKAFEEVDGEHENAEARETNAQINDVGHDNPDGNALALLQLSNGA
jgi:hypothetical protein